VGAAVPTRDRAKAIYDHVLQSMAYDKVEPGWLPGDANYCRMQTTANRALLLRKLGAAVNPR